MPLSPVPNLALALPEIFMVLAGMALLMVGVFQRNHELATASGPYRLVSRLSVIALAFALVLVIIVGGRSPAETFGGMFVVDDFATFVKVLIVLASALSLVIAQDYLELYKIARFEYAVLILFATAGMLVMVSANDLIALYLGLEMQSLALYVIASFQRDDVQSSEAGLKYFVLGSLASGMLLYGSSLIYGFAGTTNFTAMAQSFQGFEGQVPPLGVILGIVFILAGLAFKVSAVPFHMWTPDVYEGAPTPVTAFFSIAPKLAAIGLLVRVLMDPFADLVGQWRQIIIVISVASMALGAVAAIGQSNFKRLMAYSSISHVGYALIGLAAGTEAGVRGLLIYMGIYIIMNLGVFTCILAMRRRDTMPVGIADLAGLSKTNPPMALALAIFMFSMAGIPPLAGFFGKVYIFLAAVEAGLYTLAVIGVLTSVVAAYYYIRIVKIMYFDEPKEPLDREIGRNVGLVMLGTAVIIVFFILFADPFLAEAGQAAASLFAG